MKKKNFKKFLLSLSLITFVAGLANFSFAATSQADLDKKVLHDLIAQVHQHVFTSFSQKSSAQIADRACSEGESMLDYVRWLLRSRESHGANHCLTETVKTGRQILGAWLVEKPRALIEDHPDIRRLMDAPDLFLSSDLKELRDLLTGVLNEPLRFRVMSISESERICEKMADDGTVCLAPVALVKVSVQLVPEVIDQLQRLGRADEAEELRNFAAAEYLVTLRKDDHGWFPKLTDVRLEGEGRVEGALAKLGAPMKLAGIFALTKN